MLNPNFSISNKRSKIVSRYVYKQYIKLRSTLSSNYGMKKKNIDELTWLYRTLTSDPAIFYLLIILKIYIVSLSRADLKSLQNWRNCFKLLCFSPAHTRGGGIGKIDFQSASDEGKLFDLLLRHFIMTIIIIIIAHISSSNASAFVIKKATREVHLIVSSLPRPNSNSH